MLWLTSTVRERQKGYEWHNYKTNQTINICCIKSRRSSCKMFWFKVQSRRHPPFQGVPDLKGAESCDVCKYTADTAVFGVGPWRTRHSGSCLLAAHRPCIRLTYKYWLVYSKFNMTYNIVQISEYIIIADDIANKLEVSTTLSVGTKAKAPINWTLFLKLRFSLLYLVWKPSAITCAAHSSLLRQLQYITLSAVDVYSIKNHCNKKKVSLAPMCSIYKHYIPFHKR